MKVETPVRQTTYVMEHGPTGYIVHWSSEKLVHPYGSSASPADNTKLVVNSEGRRREGAEDKLQVRFVAVPECGHFGYIEHVLSGKIVHISGYPFDPGNNSSLIWHTDRHVGCLFAFDLENNYIIHSSGKIWHPYGGNAVPANNAQLVLHAGRHDGARFYFVDANMKRASPYPPPHLDHEWRLLGSSLDPQEQHQISITFKVGMYRSKTANHDRPYTWTISGKDARKLFSSSDVYASVIDQASPDAWKEETEVKTIISVSSGESVVIWQCDFILEQFGEEYKFRSSILECTDSTTKQPQLSEN